MFFISTLPVYIRNRKQKNIALDISIEKKATMLFDTITLLIFICNVVSLVVAVGLVYTNPTLKIHS